MLIKNNIPITILDTHVWLWLLSGIGSRLDTAVIEYIEKAAKVSKIGICAISVWEVGILEAKNRISLKMDCLDWINQALNAPGISLIPLSPKIAIKSTRLPGNFHGDPADRIIVATAMILQGTLITYDQKIQEYAAKNQLNLLPPG